jgi:hypothetical protein
MLAAFRGTPQEIPLLRDWQRIRDQSTSLLLVPSGPDEKRAYRTLFHAADQEDGDQPTIHLEAFGGPKATGHWLRFEDFRVFGPEGWELTVE